MNNSENNSPRQEIFSIRNLSFGVMVLAIAAVFYAQSARETPAGGTGPDLEQRQFRFMIKFISYQVVRASIGPEKERKQFAEMARKQLRGFEESGQDFRGTALVQKYIILSHLGTSPKELKTEFSPAARKAKIVREFNDLYLKGKTLPDSAEIFKSPAGNLALLRQAEVGKNAAKVGELKQKLMGEAGIWLLVLTLIGMSFLGVMLANIIALWVFHYRKPVPQFHLALALIPEKTRRLLLETPILYLFMMFPLAFVMQELFQQFAVKIPARQLLYIPLIFLLAMIFYIRGARSEGGQAHLRELILERDVSFTREVFFGITGFVVIFPIALITLLITIQLTDAADNGAQFAHPIANQIADYPLRAFILAVIIAPITEEIIFRSFIYGYLRTRLPIGIAGMITGAIFAVLHPQGYVALPYLFVLGTGLCILREMRPGVLAPIVTHMCVNALAIGSAFLLFRI